MNRREFTAKIKVAAFKRSGGICECGCGQKLMAGKIQYDHRIADAMGGEPTLENCEVLTKGCHDLKTHKLDIPTIAEAKRREAAHIGATAKSARPIQSRGFAKKQRAEKQHLPRQPGIYEDIAS